LEVDCAAAEAGSGAQHRDDSRDTALWHGVDCEDAAMSPTVIDEAFKEKVLAFVAAHGAPLDLRAILPGDGKVSVTLAVFRLVDEERLCFTTDRRVTVPKAER
jgi:hypothetical protein